MENTPTRTFDPAVLFELLIGVLCDVVEIVGPRHGVKDAVIGLIWRRVRSLGDRLAKLVERMRVEGFCDTAPAARARGASVRVEAADLPPLSALGKLRQHRGWLVHMMHELSGSRQRMYWVLARPEVKELLAEAPLQMGRILRPLCRMLGVEVPRVLLLAERERRAAMVVAVPVDAAKVRAAPRPRVVKKYPPAPDFLANDPEAVHRPDGSIWMHYGSSTHWKPGCGETLEEARKYDPPLRVWPRED